VLLFEDLTKKIIGAAVEVHKILGPGFLESVYEEALAKEMDLRGIRFERQDPIRVIYKHEQIGNYRPDFLVEDKVVVEIKAVPSLVPAHKAQAIHYLAATRLHLALLLNFGDRKLAIKRVIL
jgi:GxxExxY protein